MCGRYTTFTDEENAELEKIIDEVNQKNKDQQVKIGEIFPTNPAPVLLARGEELSAELMVWGFPNFYNKGVLINARSETAAEKKTFAAPLKTRRCVVPAAGFFEWSHGGGEKKKFLFGLPDKKTLYMAGLYSEYDGQMRFVILTTAANDAMAPIHDRLPVILHRDEAWGWVKDLGMAQAILHRPGPNLTMIQV